MEQTPEERKAFLAELNQIAHYTGTILHGEDVPKGRIKQLKKYFNKTYKMLHRLANRKGEINNNSFKHGYGGKVLCRKVLLQLEVIKKKQHSGKEDLYDLCIPSIGLTLELVSRIIVEVYLIRNEIEPL